MEPHELPRAAKKAHEEIEALIPQITTLDEDDNGNKEYGGEALPALITSMKVALGIDEVKMDVACFHGTWLILIIRLGKDT